jgi:hypothetical protein
MTTKPTRNKLNRAARVAIEALAERIAGRLHIAECLTAEGTSDLCDRMEFDLQAIRTLAGSGLLTDDARLARELGEDE